MKLTRILFYSHDTFGLGHIRRTQKLANQIASENTSILIACSSPKASSFASHPGIEYLNLPGFTKQMSGDYVPRSLNLSIEEFVQLRASLLLSTVRTFAPDIVIVDKEPLGVKRELLPALEFLRSYSKKTKIICGFRDILDDADTVHKEWTKRDTTRILEYYYDHILIYGDQNFFDFQKEYILSSTLSQKIFYTGFINPHVQHEKKEVASQNISDVQYGLKKVTLTLGGGGDGADILNLVIDYFEKNNDLEFELTLLTGPFIQPEIYKKVLELSLNIKNLQVLHFTSNTTDLFKSSDLVVSMGGYNTMTELLSLKKFPLILPRTKPRKEQLIRAKKFSELGLCQYIDPKDLNAHTLFATIRSLLQKPEKKINYELDGLLQFKKWIQTYANK